MRHPFRFALDKPLIPATLFLFYDILQPVVQIIEGDVLVVDAFHKCFTALLDTNDFLAIVVDFPLRTAHALGRAASVLVIPEQVRGTKLVQLLKRRTDSRENIELTMLLREIFQLAVDRAQLHLEFIECAPGLLELLP